MYQKCKGVLIPIMPILCDKVIRGYFCSLLPFVEQYNSIILPSFLK